MVQDSKLTQMRRKQEKRWEKMQMVRKAIAMAMKMDTRITFEGDALGFNMMRLLLQIHGHNFQVIESIGTKYVVKVVKDTEQP